MGDTTESQGQTEQQQATQPGMGGAVDVGGVLSAILHDANSFAEALEASEPYTDEVRLSSPQLQRFLTRLAWLDGWLSRGGIVPERWANRGLDLGAFSDGDLAVIRNELEGTGNYLASPECSPMAYPFIELHLCRPAMGRTDSYLAIAAMVHGEGLDPVLALADLRRKARGMKADGGVQSAGVEADDELHNEIEKIREQMTGVPGPEGAR